MIQSSSLVVAYRGVAKYSGLSGHQLDWIAFSPGSFGGGHGSQCGAAERGSEQKRGRNLSSFLPTIPVRHNLPENDTRQRQNTKQREKESVCLTLECVLAYPSSPRLASPSPDSHCTCLNIASAETTEFALLHLWFFEAPPPRPPSDP